MSWILAWPWAALGLLSVPLLVGLYMLRQRSRRRPVSSLLLWRGEPPHRESGRRVERFQSSRLFWLELLILLLLVAAALGPRLPTPDSRRPLVVVLDDSFSMQAGAPSAREQGRRALLQEINSERHLNVRLIRAGQEPAMIDADDGSAGLAKWQARSTTAALDDALALAFESGGPRARILVITDRPPEEELTEPRLLWWAFGAPQANLAIVGAARRAASPDRDAVSLVEVRNASGQSAQGRLEIRLRNENADEDASPESETVQTLELSLAAEEIGRYRFNVPRGRAAVITLQGNGADALPYDNRAVLLPESTPPVRVRLELADDNLRGLVERTLRATGRVRFVNDEADLVISPRPGAVNQDWRLRLLREERAASYLGPFVIDRSHPLAEGLSLDGAIWGAGETDARLERPSVLDTTVVSAGDTPLLIDRPRAAGREILMRFRADASTLQQTPDWPILWWNLVTWRAASTPGIERPNVRLGETVDARLERGLETASWRLPSGAQRTLAVENGLTQLRPEEPGVHRLVTPKGSESFAVNVLAAEESDLRGSANGRWGDWEAADAFGGHREPFLTYRDLGWLLLLMALALLVLHLVWSRPAAVTVPE